MAGHAEVGADAERQLRRVELQPGRRERPAAGRRDDDVGGERAVPCNETVACASSHGDLGELGAADEARARPRRARRRRERGERVVEPVEWAVEKSIAVTS